MMDRDMAVRMGALIADLINAIEQKDMRTQALCARQIKGLPPEFKRMALAALATQPATSHWVLS